MMKDDEPAALLALLALAATLYLFVWLIEQPGDGEELLEPAPVESATPRQS
jgi:hypothetical protein